LNDEELHGFCFSQNIIKRSVENGVWAENVARMREKGMHIGFGGITGWKEND
jgi:hypothetical protein